MLSLLTRDSKVLSDVYIAILSLRVASHFLKERNMLFENRAIKWKHFHLDCQRGLKGNIRQNQNLNCANSPSPKFDPVTFYKRRATIIFGIFG